MSKRKVGRRGESARRQRRVPRKVVLVVIAVSLLSSGVALSRWGSPRVSKTADPGAAAPAQSGLPLAKEYIYAGGRLVATEEPNALGPPPTGLLAAALSATGVNVTWGPPASGSVASYVVERSQNINGPFTPLTSTETGTTFQDSTATANTAYLYRVRAVFAGGGSSEYSNTDLATTVIFTEDPLQVNSTTVQAVHLTQLRTAVDAVRALTGSSSATWDNNPAPQQGGLIRASHFLELRANLNPALSALGLSELPADNTLAVGQPIKAVHVQDVRNKVK